MIRLAKKTNIILLVLCAAFAASYFYVNRADFLPKPKPKPVQHIGIVSLSPAAPEIMFVDPSAPSAVTDEIAKSGVRIIIIPKPQRVEDIYFNINFIASNIGKNSSELVRELKEMSGAREYCRLCFYARGGKY